MDIPVKIDPGQGISTLKGITDGLHKTEDQGIAAGKSMQGLAGSFKSLGQAIEQQHAALRRSTLLHEEFARKNQPLAQGFAKLAEQLEREKRALDSIRGPAQEAMRDIQTLSMLLSKGAITAHEFNTKLAAIRPPSNFQRGGGAVGGGFDASAIAGALPGGGIIAGAIGGGVAGAATAGLQTAIGGAHEVIAMADAYTGLNNRLKALTGSQSEATALFGKLHASANKTYSDVNTTTDSFVKFARALKGVGATQDQAISFTEHLNEVIAMSGTDATGANAAMLQLGQALSSGVLRGEEFNSVIEQAPALLDPIAKHLGVTVGALRQLAQDGKITSKVIFDSFNEAGPSIEKAFGQAIPTISQQFQRLKNDVGVAVGELAKDANLTKIAADSLAGLKDVVAASLAPVKLLNDGLHELGMTLGDLAGGGFGGMAELKSYIADLDAGGNFMDKFMNAGQRMSDQQEVINRTVAAGTGHLNEYSQSMVKQTLQTQLGESAAVAFTSAMDIASGKTDAWRDKTDSLGSTFSKLVNGAGNELVEWLTNTKGKLDEAANAMDPWFGAHEKAITLNDRISQAMTTAGFVWDGLTKKIEKQATAAKAHTKEMNALARALLGSESPSDRAIRAGAAERAGNESENDLISKLEEGTATAQLELFNARLAQLDDLQKRAAISAEAYETARNDAFSDAFTKGLLGSGSDIELKGDADWKDKVAAWEEVSRSAREEAEKTRQAWASALGSIGKSFIDAAIEGKQSFSEMAEHMAVDIARLILQMAALNMAKQGGNIGFAGTLLSGLLGGGEHGFDYVANANRVQLPGFEHGVDGVVGGVGRPDSRLLMARISPGESFHVRTPQQRDSEERSGSGSMQVTNQIVIQSDPSEIVAPIGSRSGARAVLKTMRKMGRRQ